MRKVMTLVGTRPELIKMSRVIPELDRHTNHILVHSGQNFDYELNQVFFDDLEIRKPDYFLGVASDTPMKTIAEILTKTDALFEQERPEALLLYGDTNTGLAIIAAKRRKIPVIHMEAGNRCFDQRVPEELNRKVLDHLADLNLVLTEHARRYLLGEGIRPETIIKTGSHMDEVLAYYLPKVEQSDVLERQAMRAREFFIVSAHREENVDSIEKLDQFIASLNAVAEQYSYPVLVSTHPRTRQRLERRGPATIHKLVQFAKPFGWSDYMKLQLSAFCVLSDSGTLTEEASLLDLPAVMLRDAHERPEGMDEGTLIMSGLRRDRVLDAIRIVTSQREPDRRTMPLVKDYPAPAVSKQVVRIVVSYIDYIDRTVWQKPSSLPLL